MIQLLVLYISRSTVAGRTTLVHPILRALEGIAFDPFRILLIETSYQPFISLFHMMGVLGSSASISYIFLQVRPTLLRHVANYASALAFELLRGPAPEFRDFIRIKFKNGTDSDFQTIRVFGNEEDSLPMTASTTWRCVRCPNICIPCTVCSKCSPLS